jgi:hypothetical protein
MERTMIIDRVIRTAKPGCKYRLIKVLKNWVEWSGAMGRVYTSNVNYDTVISDIDFETEQDRQRFYDGLDWSQWKSIEAPEKIDDLRAPGMTWEILTLH